MNEAMKKIEELKKLVRLTDEESKRKVDEIAIWFKDHKDPESQELFDRFMTDGLEEIEVEIADIRRQIEDEDYRLLPISYIAKKYFGKSQSWLSQRINGTKVRGHVYTLNDEQKKIFNTAMEDLSKFYGSFRLA
jgi:hypothetical protein